ncbi:MAG: ribonuclease P [Candidatus Nanoarchaeia archaeon]|nr:ribonuclease P [Candidatus Nanoarchaeia archaeon]
MQKNNNLRKKEKDREIALERIESLFNQAKEVFKKDSSLSDRYVKIANKIAMKTKTKIPAKFKRNFCKHCLSYLKPGINCRIRTKNKNLIYYCMNCKKYTKFGLKKPK